MVLADMPATLKSRMANHIIFKFQASFCTTFVLATQQADMLQCTDYAIYNVFIVHNIL